MSGLKVRLNIANFFQKFVLVCQKYNLVYSLKICSNMTQAVNVSKEKTTIRVRRGGLATAPYFYESILLRALKSKIIVLLTYVYKK
jgi:hypothetical protein